MNDVIVQSRSSGLSAPVSGASAIAGTIDRPPPELAQLSPGHILRGVVVSSDGRGQTQVRTDHGTFLLNTSHALTPDSEIALEIRSLGARLHVLVLQAKVASQAAAQQAQLAAASGDPRAAAGTPQTTIPSDQITVTQPLLQAILQSLPPGPEALPPQFQKLPPGAQLQLRLISLQLPGPPGTAPTTSTTPAAGTAAPQAGVPSPAGGALTPTTTPGQPSPTTAGVQTGPNLLSGIDPAQVKVAGKDVAQALQSLGSRNAVGLLKPGVASLTTRVAADGPLVPSAGGAGGTTATPGASPTSGTITPGAATLGTAAGTPPGTATILSQTSGAASTYRIEAHVIAIKSTGQAVISTPLGTLTLATKTSWPVGTTLHLEALPPNTTAQAIPAGGAAAWMALAEALQVSALVGQEMALARDLPKAGPKLGSGILLFLSAMRGGNLPQWLTQQMAPLQQAGRGDLAARLTREFGQAGQKVKTQAGDWRLIHIPLLSGNEVQDLKLFLRDDMDSDPEDLYGAEEEDATRFVLEIEMSRLGGLQLDGLVQAKRFDLILRTEQPLPQEMRKRITEIFQEANEISGIAGALSFVATPDWQLHVSEGPEDAPHPDLSA